MRRFDNTRLWKVLPPDNHPTALPSELDATLDEFIGELHNYCREEKDIAGSLPTTLPLPNQ